MVVATKGVTRVGNMEVMPSIDCTSACFSLGTRVSISPPSTPCKRTSNQQRLS